MNKVDSFILELKKIYAENLISVILYGSSVNDKNLFLKAKNINLVVILNKLNASHLKQCYPAIKNWKKTGNPVPVFMEREEWFCSIDVYPMEYSEIINRNRILYGENVLNFINIDKSDLRKQCEYEVKNLLIRLRKGYLLNSADKNRIREMLTGHTDEFIRIFRAFITLLDENPTDDEIETIKQISGKVNFEPEVFIELTKTKLEKNKILSENNEEKLQKIINSFDILLKYVDNLEVKTRGE